MTKLVDSLIKCSVLVVLTLFAHTSAFSQIDILDTPKPKIIAETKGGGQMHMQLEELAAIADSLVTYRMWYKDARYPTLYSLETFDIPNHETLIDLKEIILGAFSNADKKFSASFIIDGEYITVRRESMLGSSSVRIMVLHKGYTYNYQKFMWERFFRNIK